MSEWQPISTAPKDGTRILAGRFTGAGKQQDQDGWMAVTWYRQPKDEAGYIGWGEFNMTHWPPTHWQPLPLPPQQSQEEGMNSTWQEIATAPEGIVVETMISDGRGERNFARLRRQGRLWFFPDMSMYVYYTPTHWRPAA